MTITIMVLLAIAFLASRRAPRDEGISTGDPNIRMATPGSRPGTVSAVLPINAQVEIVMPVAYVLLRRVGRTPDVGSVGIVGTRTREARAFGGWAVWRYGASRDGTVWRRAIAIAREKINDEWSPDADAIIGGAVSAIVALVGTAVGIVTGGAAAAAALVGYGAYIARTATTSVAMRDAMVAEGQRLGGELAADIRRIHYEYRTFERIFHASDYPQPSLAFLRTINRDKIARFALAPNEYTRAKLGSDAEVNDWREAMLNAADERVRALDALTEEQIARAG